MQFHAAQGIPDILKRLSTRRISITYTETSTSTLVETPTSRLVDVSDGISVNNGVLASDKGLTRTPSPSVALGAEAVPCAAGSPPNPKTACLSVCLSHA